ncbi:MAG: tyrosine-type recombinase/integrase [Sulfitobacter sp.]|nr:tyrosine-type recombinase/integrase [Sulfitobacter sp.]
MTKLRKAMMEAMLLRGFSERTQESYIKGVFGIAKYYRLSPDQLSDQQVRHYLVHLLRERKLAYSSCNVALNAIRFLFREVLLRPRNEIHLPGPRQPQRLPEILSREEVGRILEAATDLRHKTLLRTAYGAGLRVSEVCHLRVKDIDSDRMSIRVEQGKGAKDRYTLLSPHLLVQLRNYWRTYQPDDWMFVHRNGVDPLPVDTVQKIFYQARDKAGIRKRGGIHGLRHAFATHLLEAGVDIHTIQKLLGHRSIRSTLRYFHLAQVKLLGTRSPLDLLAQVPQPDEEVPESLG